MPFIEDFISHKNCPVEPVGLPLDAEYTLRTVELKTRVYKHLAGCVFIGSNSEASRYVAQQRTKQAIARAEKELRLGSNPFITR